MKPTLSEPMSEILALTRAGRLADAAAMIQGALGAGGPETTSAAQTEGDLGEPASDAIRSLLLEQPDPTPGGSPRRTATSGSSARKGSFTRHAYSGDAGRLGYRLYIPATQHQGMPLVVMLHGCTQSPEDFARGTRMNELAEEQGFLVAYPEQTQAANAQKCWNWFRPGDQARGSGEPALIAGLTREIMERHSVDPRRVYVAGLSAGGAAAAIMAATYPDLYAAVGIHSGLACGSARDLPSALAAMNGKGVVRSRPRTGRAGDYVPTITVHGDQDRTVHPSNSKSIHEAGASDPKIAALKRIETQGVSQGGRRYRCVKLSDAHGVSWAEHWHVEGSGHAWSGGSAEGSYTDPAGPDASREMLRFFLQHERRSA